MWVRGGLCGPMLWRAVTCDLLRGLGTFVGVLTVLKHLSEFAHKAVGVADAYGIRNVDV